MRSGTEDEEDDESRVWYFVPRDFRCFSAAGKTDQISQTGAILT